jgi:Holliday junction resolvase RusA-like endonuclease
MYDPPKSAAWKRDIKAQLRREKNHKVREGALSVALEFYLSRPKSLPKSATRHIKRPDVDNLAKAVLDAMRGEVYRDDAQIEQLRVSKRYSESTGVTIDIEELT